MTEFLVGGTIGMVQTLAGHPLDTVKTMLQNGQKYRHFGFRDYYRGVVYPLVASVSFNMVAFPVYDYTIDKTKNAYLAGLYAGLAVSGIEYGFSVGKIRRQTLTSVEPHLRGFTMAYIRTTLAMCVYFGVYDDLKSTTGPLIAGAAGGLANWTLTYPFDIISTRQIATGCTIRAAIKQGHLWRGYLPCAMRAILVNGLSFKLYDMSKNI